MIYYENDEEVDVLTRLGNDVVLSQRHITEDPQISVGSVNFDIERLSRKAGELENFTIIDSSDWSPSNPDVHLRSSELFAERLICKWTSELLKPC